MSSAAKDSSVIPQPVSMLAIPARVYITVSRSGQMRRPQRSKSSAVFTTTARFPGGSTTSRPAASFAPPTPPARAQTFKCFFPVRSSGIKVPSRYRLRLYRLSRRPSGGSQHTLIPVRGPSAPDKLPGCDGRERRESRVLSELILALPVAVLVGVAPGYFWAKTLAPLTDAVERVA